MKKLFTIAAVAMFSLAMVACQSNVDKGKKLMDQMYEAVEAGDLEKALKLSAEMEELDKELTDEERAELEKYAEKFGDF